MARLTISEASEQFSVGRSTLYRAVSNGKISVHQENGVKYIDSSEMVRVFSQSGTGGTVPRDNLDTSRDNERIMLESENDSLKKQNRLLERLASSQEKNIAEKEAVIVNQREIIAAFFKRLNPPKKK